MIVRAAESTLLDQVPRRYVLVVELSDARHTPIQCDLRTNPNDEECAVLEEISLEKRDTACELRRRSRWGVERAEVECRYPILAVRAGRSDCMAVQGEEIQMSSSRKRDMALNGY